MAKLSTDDGPLAIGKNRDSNIDTTHMVVTQPSGERLFYGTEQECLHYAKGYERGFGAQRIGVGQFKLDIDENPRQTVRTTHCIQLPSDQSFYFSSLEGCQIFALGWEHGHERARKSQRRVDVIRDPVGVGLAGHFDHRRLGA